MFRYIILLLLLFSVPLMAQEKEKGKLASFEDEASGRTDESDDEAIAAIIVSDLDDCGYCAEGFFHGLTNFVHIMIYSEEFDRNFIDNHYTPYPYYNRNSGRYGENTDKNFSLVLSSSYFHHTDHLNGFILAADLSPYPLVSLRLSYADLTETLRTRYDHLRLYNLFIHYNRLRSEKVVFSWGIGFKGIRGDADITAPALSTAFEFYPIEPLSFSIQYNIGYYSAATVADFAANLNLHFDRYRFRIGYQNFRSGTVNIGGLSFGLGIYF